MLLTDRRRRTFEMRDEGDTDRLQGSLFGPDAFAPARPAGPTPDPFAPARAARPPERAEAPPAASAAGPPPELPMPSEASPPAAGFDEVAGRVDLDADAVLAREDGVDALVAPQLAAAADLAPDVEARVDYAEDLDVLPPPDYLDELAPDVASPASRAQGAREPLSGPTLDDVMSRVWETMRAQVPAPCPVCHAEVEPSMGGRCGACGSSLD